jgi:hypothetical protein
VTRWAKEDMDRKKLLQNICEYPYQFVAATTGSVNGDANTIQHPDYIITNKKSRTSYSTKPFQNRKRGMVQTSLSHQGKPGMNKVKKETLYLGEHDLGNGNYAVEIITTTTE